MNKTFILPCAKHPGKSYRSRHNKSCQGLTETKTLAGERSPKTETEDPLEKKGRKRCKYVIFPVLSMFPPHHVFHCTKDALLGELPGSLISINASKFPGYYWLCYSVCLFLFFLCLGFLYISYTQMIAEIDGINFVFLFSTFCQLSRQAFISNRINERVSGKPTNLNWPPRTSGVKYIPENASIESPKLHVFLETLETFRAYFGWLFPGTVWYL